MDLQIEVLFLCKLQRCAHRPIRILHSDLCSVFRIVTGLSGSVGGGGGTNKTKNQRSGLICVTLDLCFADDLAGMSRLSDLLRQVKDQGLALTLYMCTSS